MVCCFPATHAQWCLSVWCSEAAGSLAEKEKPNPKENNPLVPLVAKRETPTTFHCHWSACSLVPFENMAKPTKLLELFRNDSEIPAIKRSSWSLLVEFVRQHLTPISQLPELLLGFGKPFTSPAFPQVPFLYILSIAISSIRPHWSASIISTCANGMVQRHPSHTRIKYVVIVTTQEKTPNKGWVGNICPI